MKKQYSRKQIREAISYWKRRLRKMNESAGDMHIQVKAVVDGREWSEDTGEPRRYSAVDPNELLISDAVFNMMTSLAEEGCYIDRITQYLVDGEDRTAEAEELRKDYYSDGRVTVQSDDDDDYDGMYESRKRYTKKRIMESVSDKR